MYQEAREVIGVVVLLVSVAGLAGLIWGTADFCGGKASRHADALRVVSMAKLASVPLLALLVSRSGARLDPDVLVWGALAGTCGTLGTAVFYRALASGSMALVAPVTAVTPSGVPVAVGLATCERPPAAALGGVLCAVLAVALVSLAGRRPLDGVAHSRCLGLAGGAGLGFALFLVCLAEAARSTPVDDGLWPLLVSHLTGLLLGGAILLRYRRGARPALGWPRGRTLAWSVAAGVLDTAGSAAYLAASRLGDLSLVAPLAALYPSTTVLLAMVVDKERPRRPQLVGLLLAGVALDLVARTS